jgi:hypothetical protein
MQKLLITTGFLAGFGLIGLHAYFGGFVEPVEALKTIIGGF